MLHLLQMGSLKVLIFLLLQIQCSSANCGPQPNCGPLSNFEWATGYLLLFQFSKVVVGRVIAAAYMHCSLKVGVAKSFSFGLLLHHSSTACRFLKH